jgi:hypothetical protein
MHSVSQIASQRPLIVQPIVSRKIHTVSKNATISAICCRFPMRNKSCETLARIWAMNVVGQFTMTRIEILAVSLSAANLAEDPNRSPAIQLRRLLGI